MQLTKPLHAIIICFIALKQLPEEVHLWGPQPTQSSQAHHFAIFLCSLDVDKYDNYDNHHKQSKASTKIISWGPQLTQSSLM